MAILSINIKTSAIVNTNVSSDINKFPNIEESIAEIFRKSFSSSRDFKNNNVLVNSTPAEGDNPASATVFIDLDECSERDHILVQLQKALADYMLKTMVAIEQHPPTIIMPPINPSDGSVG